MADTNPINGLCKKVMKVTDEQLAEMEEMTRSQCEYISPLKLASQARTNNAGSYNARVLAAFRNLRSVLLAGPSGAARKALEETQ